MKVQYLLTYPQVCAISSLAHIDGTILYEKFFNSEYFLMVNI